MPLAMVQICVRRTFLTYAMPLAMVQWRPPAAASAWSPFDRLGNRYYLLRPGETTFEAADMVDSNPINKQQTERGLTSAGREQVRRAADALLARNVTTPTIFYDNGARATQTADIIAEALMVPRVRVEPEFRWLEGRGYGVLDGGYLQLARARMRALDLQDSASAAPEAEDGTPSDSVEDVFVRLRNTVLKIENTYSGTDVVIVGGDSTVLSAFAAAACGVDLGEHGRFELRPGEFHDLRELQAAVRMGTYIEPKLDKPSAEAVAAGRAALQEMGSRMFADTAAGAWVLGDVKR